MSRRSTLVDSADTAVQVESKELAQLPSPEIVLRQLYATLSEKDTQSSCISSISLKSLLDTHPAFVQLLAKNVELRKVIEDGAESLFPHSRDTSNGRAGAHVLWNMCTCVWKGIGVLLESFARRLPGNETGQSEQLRLLMQSNSELRSQLQKCRRDYLRELTELRERCRHIDADADNALVALLREEPVMFYEPLDFAFDDVTKDFIRNSVDEKLRLLMLKDWGKIPYDEIRASTARIKELEAEVVALKSQASRSLVTSVTEVSSFRNQSIKYDLEGLSLLELETDKDVDNDDENECDSARCSTSDSARCSHDMSSKIEIASTRCSTAGTSSVGLDSARCSTFELTRCSTALSSNGGIGSPLLCSPRMSPSLDALDERLDEVLDKRKCPMCTAMRKKISKLCMHLRESVGQEMIAEALASAGLFEDVETGRKKKESMKNKRQTVFDRLHADASKRVEKIRQHSDDVHSLQGKQIASCATPGVCGPVKKRAEQLKQLHSKSMSSASMLHDAFDSFHAKRHASALECQIDDESVLASPDRPASSESGEVLPEPTIRKDNEAGIRKKLEELHKLYLDELEHCSSAAKSNVGQGPEALKVLCEHSIKAARELQDALEVLCKDVRKELTQGSPTKSAHKDTHCKTLHSLDFEFCGSPVHLRRCSSLASVDSEPVLGEASPERKKIFNQHSTDAATACGQSFAGAQVVSKVVLQPLQPTCLGVDMPTQDKLSSLWKGHLTQQDMRFRVDVATPNFFGEPAAAYKSPEKRRSNGYEDSGPATPTTHSVSPEKKKTRPLMEESPDKKKFRALIEESPDKRKTRPLVEESLLQGYPLSNSPEKQKSKPMLTVSAGCSPEKLRKASVARATQLDPLRHVPKALNTSGMDAFTDRDLLHAQERGRLKKSESLPQLARLGGAHAVGS